ncbi:DUF2845 domain-containing protein [Dyella terrae]|uniref:DUF2845 domain-containing protein n=3 Tax=Rhodanobacteraceae TaxID=1775411 RepID=A0A4V2NLG0_9GAMM|nr:DUF2845 domain-containing protein [Dyella terrae]TCI08714.1 DUF2845 domain-containing protein [Dyella soli]
MIWAGASFASDTLRVGSRVLVTGDSSARVVDLLGQPSTKQRGSSKPGRRAGTERWHYRRGQRITTISVAEGRVVHIDEQRL